MATKQPTAAFEVAAKAGITYSSHKYTHDPSHDSYGLEAAEKLGIEAFRVFKTLVVDVGGKLGVAVVPVEKQLDLKAFASALKTKSATMADVALAERTTGYVAGGISPLGQKKQLPTVIDSSALLLETVFVSAGRRGQEIELSPTDLVQLTKAIIADIAR